MRLTALSIFAACLASSSAQAAGFREARLDDKGRKLTITESAGRAFSAPRSEDQDSFEKPGVSRNHRYVGWLALFPNGGASYSQPLYLAVLDSSKKMERFAGDFGMVYGWCFTKDSTAVVYRYQFPHGATPIGFDMRSLRDGRILRSFRLEPMGPDEDEEEVIRESAPEWTKCAQASATAQ